MLRQSPAVPRWFRGGWLLLSREVAPSTHVPLYLSHRHHSTGGPDNGIPSSPPFSSSSLPKRGVSLTSEATTPKPLGVVELNSHNISQEMDTLVPLFLYFTVKNHPDVKEYTEKLIIQVDKANRRRQHEEMGEKYNEEGPDGGLAVKLGIIDCLKEPGLTQKFAVDPHMFPIVYFVRKKLFVDKLYGIVTEAQIKDAIDAFIDYAVLESKNEKEGNGVFNRLKREDNDDENSMTLLQVAHKHLKEKEMVKATQMFQKAYNTALDEIKLVDERYGVSHKKRTPQLWNKLKREGCYNSAPLALSGLGMCALASLQMEEAKAYATQIREEFPYAIKEISEVAEAVVRIEIMTMTEYDVVKDNYAKLMKKDDFVDDPVAFYQQRLKLVVCHYVEGKPKSAISEGLRLVRAEPKLLPALKQGGVLPKDFVLGPTSTTPARQLVLKLFEALGETNEMVIEGRKLFQVYT